MSTSSAATRLAPVAGLARASLGLALLCGANLGHAAPLPVPALAGHVNDRAGLLPAATRARLEAQLSAFEQQTAHQFAVLITDTLQGEAVETYALRVAEAWKLGQARHDNGLLLLIALNDRRMRIEVGYGLEGSIPDLLAARIVRNVLTPAFRARDFGGGIERALALLMDAARGLKVEVPAPARARRGPAPGGTLLWLVIALAWGVGSLALGARRQRLLGGRGGRRRGIGGLEGLAGLGLGLGGPWVGPRERGSHRGGGLWGGGGGGGFSGGGGGFGGGGASGGW
ncbi:MAG: TPM domain-containing protein [Proteobacteria bacterium]|nr:TPM domain-containing protein [Pseudomonadota bacterium]